MKKFEEEHPKLYVFLYFLGSFALVWTFVTIIYELAEKFK